MKRVWTSARGVLADRCEDERGATFILTAICMVVLLWGGAVGVDLGLTVATNRQAQAISDTAALDMTRYIDIADNMSQSTAGPYLAGKLGQANTDNGTNAGLSYTPGLWSGGTFTANGYKGGGCYKHIPAATQPCNAVEVTAKEMVPQVFLSGAGAVSRTSIAAVTPQATFSIGTYLVNANTTESPVLNAILGGLGSANISIADYDGMANTYVSISQLIAASGGLLTTSDVMTTSLTAQQWQSIWLTAVGNVAGTCSTQTSPCEAQAGLSSPTVFSASTSAELCQLVNITTSSSTNGTNALGCNSGSTSPLSTSALSTQLNVLQTFETEAELANGPSAVNINSVLGLPDVATLSLETDLISPPVIATGPTGTVAQTSQIQATLNLNISIAGLNYTMAVEVNGALGTATLDTLQCTGNALSDAIIQPLTTALSASNSSVIVGGISAPGSLSVTGYTSSNPALGFAPSYVPPTSSTAAAGDNPQTAVPPALSVNLNTPTGTPGVLAPVVSALLDVLQPIFQAAGVSFGGASVAYLSTNCGGVSLVQ